MGLSVKTGTFNTTTNVATTQVAVTGVGFQPSFVKFFAAPELTAAGVTTAGGSGDSGLAVGFAVSSTKRGYASMSDQDGQSTSDSARAFGSDGCFGHNRSDNGAQGRMDFVSMDADGFTMVIDVAFAASCLISYKAYGGTDVTGVDAGVLTCTTGTGTQTISGLAFQPTGLLMLGDGASVSDPAVQTSGAMGIGFASATAQGCIQARTQDAQTTSNTASIIMTNRILGLSTASSDTLDTQLEFTGFTSDGFTLNKTVNAANAIKALWLAWAGPQIAVGTTVTRTDTSNQPVTGVGFQPSAVMLLGANATATETAMSAHANPSIGWATSSTARAAATMSSQDALATGADCQAEISTTRIYTRRNRTAADTYATIGDMDFVSMDSDGFTLDQVTADGQATLLLYLAIGVAAAAGGGGPAPKVGLGLLLGGKLLGKVA